LSRRTLLGLIKYPALISQTRSVKLPQPAEHQRKLKAKDWSPAKGIYDCDKDLFDWVIAPLSDNDKALLSLMRSTPESEFEHSKTR
ncbi:hypothetical protein OFO94_33590, partial [Escherichia coli]|nr:hypothetical protein [Escherichia coli]